MTREWAFTRAIVHTVDPLDSTAEAILVRDGRIVVAGTNEQVLAQAQPSCTVRDARGATIIPGFVDAHHHLSHTMLEPVSVDCGLPPHTSLDEVLQTIAGAAEGLLPGQWLRGFGFTPWALPDEREPSRQELDEAVPANPFFLQDVSCHRGWVNSAALDDLGIDEYSPQPWGGVIGKDHEGTPTGALLEAAMNPAQTRSWQDLASRDWDVTLELLSRKMRYLASLGITGVCDAAVGPDIAEFYHRADRAGALLFTVQQLHTGDDFFARQEPRREDFITRVHDRESDRLRSGTMKLFADPGFPDGPRITCSHGGHDVHRGSSWYSAREIRDIVVEADARGIDAAIHAMGNWSVDAALDAYEEVQRTGTDRERLMRIEHAFVAAPETQGPRMAHLGVDLVAMPGLIYHTGPSFDQGWRAELRDELTIIPIGSMIDAGVRVSFASDAPTGPISPVELMWNAVTRASQTGAPIDPDEAVTPVQALRCATINAAHAADRADEAGSLEPGKRANLVVLDRDILACSPDDMLAAKVIETIVDGSTVFDSRDRGIAAGSA